MCDGVDLVCAEHLIVQEPLRLFVCIIDLAREGRIAVFIHLDVGQVFGDLNVSRWVENKKKNGIVLWDCVFVLSKEHTFYGQSAFGLSRSGLAAILAAVLLRQSLDGELRHRSFLLHAVLV